MLDTPTDRDRSTDQWYGSFAAFHTHGHAQGSTQTSTIQKAKLQLDGYLVFSREPVGASPSWNIWYLSDLQLTHFAAMSRALSSVICSLTAIFAAELGNKNTCLL